jgi:hypothetical protein
MKIESWGENSEQDIKELEQQIGFALPADYRQFLLDNNGGEVTNQTFFVRHLDQEVLMDVFYGITSRYSRSLTLIFWLKKYKGEIGESELVIGRDPGGHKLLYVTAGTDKGVYYWDTNHFFAQSSEQGNAYFVADDFTAFCQALRDYSPFGA